MFSSLATCTFRYWLAILTASSLLGFDAPGALAFASVHLWIGLAIGFVAAHFFVFCNVLRITRRLELVWAAAFLALAAGATGYGLLSCPLAFGLSAVVTLIVALIEVRKPSYHGLGWHALNPQLPEWWSANAGGEGRGGRP